MLIYGICDSYFGSSLSGKDNRITARDRFIKMSQRRAESHFQITSPQDAQDREDTKQKQNQKKKGQSHDQPPSRRPGVG